MHQSVPPVLAWALSATLGLLGVLATSPVNASASTTFDVPCGDIKSLETAVGTPGSTVNLARDCTYQLTDVVVRDPYYGNAPVDDLPIITGSVTINGHGATLLAIPNSSCPNGCGRILEVGVYGTVAGHLTLNSVTLANGNLDGSAGQAGGGLSVNLGSTAILNRSVVMNNVVYCDCGGYVGGTGGGISNGGTLVLSGSRVLGNRTGFGGGIYSFGTLTIANHSQVSGNGPVEFGGGIFAGGTVTIADSTVSRNKAIDNFFGNGAAGGGIDLVEGTLNLSNATIEGNSVSIPYCCGPVGAFGGGIAACGDLAVVTIGCGVNSHYPTAVVIDHSFIRNNTASSALDPANLVQGAGFYNNGATVSFVGGVIRANAATTAAGGVADGGGVFNAAGTLTRTGTRATANIPDNWS